MWHYLIGIRLMSGQVSWQVEQTARRTGEPEEGFMLSLYNFPMPHSSDNFLRRPLLNDLCNILKTNNIDWLEAGEEYWSIDFDKLLEYRKILTSLTWLRGKILVKPLYQHGEGEDEHGIKKKSSIIFRFDEELLLRDDNINAEHEHQPTVFYSWQADSPNSTNRGFIEDCLKKAIGNLNKNDLVKVIPRIEKDTQGKSGSPDIAETILQKIDECSIFVADISIVNTPKSLTEKISIVFLSASKVTQSKRNA